MPTSVTFLGVLGGVLLFLGFVFLTVGVVILVRSRRSQLKAAGDPPGQPTGAPARLPAAVILFLLLGILGCCGSVVTLVLYLFFLDNPVY